MFFLSDMSGIMMSSAFTGRDFEIVGEERFQERRDIFFSASEVIVYEGERGDIGVNMYDLRHIFEEEFNPACLRYTLSRLCLLIDPECKFIEVVVEMILADEFDRFGEIGVIDEDVVVACETFKLC